MDTASENPTLHAETHHPGGHPSPVFYMDPTFWVAISIVAFVALVYNSGRKFFIKSTDRYAADVARQLNEAKQLRAEAEGMIASYREKQKQGFADAEAIVNQAKADAESLRAEAAKHIRDTIRNREQQSMDRIERMEAEIIKELRVKTADMAIEATQKILEEILNSQRTASLIDQAIREMPKQVH